MFGEYHASDDGLLPDAARDHYSSYTYGSGSGVASSGGAAGTVSGGSGGSVGTDANDASDGQAIHKRAKRAKQTNFYTGNK